MRKLHLVLLFLLCTPLLYAQDFNKLIHKFKDAKDATYQVVEKDAIPNGVPELQKISEVVILSLEKCDAKVKENFNKKIRTMKIKAPYQTLVKNDDKDEYTLILTKVADNLLTEIVIFNDDEGDCNFIWVKGEGLSMSDLNIGKFL